jgi:hypothetical protein
MRLVSDFGALPSARSPFAARHDGSCFFTIAFETTHSQKHAKHNLETDRPLHVEACILIAASDISVTGDKGMLHRAYNAAFNFKLAPSKHWLPIVTMQVHSE